MNKMNELQNKKINYLRFIAEQYSVSGPICYFFLNIQNNSGQFD